MKRLVIILVAVIISASVFGQAPQLMSYQAVIRDANGSLVKSQSIGMRVSILQGSSGGTAVYVETQTSTTNANGLVSLEIGGGTVVTGTFAGIDWSAGPYFIKTETDPTGGISYTITGTSQLLSVPYALHAQAADSGNYNKLTNKPTIPAAQVNSDWNSSSGVSQIVNKPTLATVATSGSYKDLTDTLKLATVATSGSYNDLSNKPTTDGSETKVTAGTNIIVTGSGTSGSPYVINDSVHAIGDSYSGGIVFYVYDNGRHGLIAATSDQSTSMRWYAGTNTNTMAFANGVGAGKANTLLIIAIQGYGDGATYAARVCNEYSVTVNGVTYGDWYLPSLFELNLLYLQRNVVGGFANSIYWSSNEVMNFDANCENFANGYQDFNVKYFTFYVRAVRAF